MTKLVHIFCCLAVVSFTSKAALIDVFYKDGTLNSNLSFLTGSDADNYQYGILKDNRTGLEWLNTINTQGRSISYVQSQLGQGGLFEGWRLAFSSELEGLLSSAGAVTNNCDAYRTDVEIAVGINKKYCGYNQANRGVPETFINYLGDNIENYYHGTSGTRPGYGGSLMYLADNYIFNNNGALTPYNFYGYISAGGIDGALINTAASSQPSTVSNRISSVALVRGLPVPQNNSGIIYPSLNNDGSTPVPEPTTFALLGLALLAILRFRRS